MNQEKKTIATTTNEIKNIVKHVVNEHQRNYHKDISQQQFLDDVAKKGLEWLLIHIEYKSSALI